MRTIDIQLTDSDYDLAVALATERGMSVEDLLRFVLGEIAAGRLPSQPTAKNPELVRDAQCPNPKSEIENQESL